MVRRREPHTSNRLNRVMPGTRQAEAFKAMIAAAAVVASAAWIRCGYACYALVGWRRRTDRRLLLTDGQQSREGMPGEPGVVEFWAW